MLIPKVWGFEDIVVNTTYCGKRMFVKEQHRSSIHVHATKDEVMLVGQDGLVYFEHGPSYDKLSGMWMQENDRIHVMPGTWHRFTAMRDSQIFEFSTSHSDSDCTRHLMGGKVGDDEFRLLLSTFVKSLGTSKILEPGEAGAIATSLREDGRLIGMCNGCFDLMHLGHVELLMQAKNRCEVLFVAVNSDMAIKKLKGPNRPYVDEVGRMGMVASCRHVDYVVRAANSTCLDVVDAIRPDVYITSTECSLKSPEAREVVQQGGIVEVVDMLPGYNTTRISKNVR